MSNNEPIQNRRILDCARCLDFVSGGLNQSSKIRPNRLFTADDGIVLYRVAQVCGAKLSEVMDRLIMILRQP